MSKFIQAFVAGATGFIALLTIFGHMIGVKWMSTWIIAPPMAVNTAICFLLVSIVLLLIAFERS